MHINASFLLKVDQVSDYIPGISTITNLVDLFQKCAVLPSKQKANISKSHYYTYIQQKSFARCGVLLIPVIGNIIVATYDFAKSKYNQRDATLAIAQSVSLSTPNQHSPKFTPKGSAVDKGRWLGKHAESLVMGKREARVSNSVQQAYSKSTVAAGYAEETARQLAAEAYGKQYQVNSSFEQWSFNEPNCYKHSLTDSYSALYPALRAKTGLINVRASAREIHLGQEASLSIQSNPVIHYHAAPSSKLPEAELHKRLEDLLELKCPCCIKDLIAQGHKFLGEAKEKASLPGVFYLATAYELYHTLNIQEYKYERQAFEAYLDKLEERLVDGQNLLHYFAAYESKSIFTYLFAERPNIRSHLNVLAGKTVKETPLQVAIRAGSMSIVHFLLEQGADFKKLDSCQNNALHHACRSQKGGVDIVHLLLRSEPILIETKNRDGQTPLHLAVLAGNAKKVEYLLDQIAGQSVLDLQDKEGNTPLHLAAMGEGRPSNQAAEDYAEIIAALVKKGANLNILNYKKKTALALVFEKTAIIQSLVQANLSFQLLISFLQIHYLSQDSLSIFRIKAQQEWEFKVPLEETYVRLGLIERKERNTLAQASDKHSEYLQDARIPTYETILEPKQKIEIEELFKHTSLEKKSRKRVFIQGAAGIGKSTLCQYISYHWAKGKLWTGMFTCLFWIPLRNLNLKKYPADKEYTPADLIAKEYAGKIEPKIIEACINDAAFLQNSLLILDGYDELSAEAQANTSLATAFKQLKELFPHILITSRPGSCSFERSCELEILGFDKEGVNRYIDRFFKHQQAEEKKEKLYHLLNASPQVLSLAQIPINLTLLCCLFNEDSQLFDTKQSVTMSAIYARVVNWMYRWFLLRRIDQGHSRQTKEQILAEKNLRQNKEVAKIATAFEEMADFAMKNNTLYLSKQEIDDFRGNKISSNELTDCGLMRLPEAEEKGYFIHLTFQEFLTASKVANQYLKGERQACQTFMQNYKFEPRYALVLRMIAGSLSLTNSSNRRYADALQSFFDDLFAAPHDLAVSSELTLIAECFEECQDPRVVKQYEGFIGLVKDYMNYLHLRGLGFERLLSNKNIFKHPQIVRTVEELLSNPKTKKSMLRILLSIVQTGLSLASEIVGLSVEEYKVSKDPEAKKIAIHVLEEVAWQGGEISKEGLAALIRAFKGSDPWPKHFAARALGVMAEKSGELPEEALATLIQAIKEGDPWLKCSAANALRVMAEKRGELPEEALAALIQAIKEGDPRLKRSAASALGVMAEKRGELPEEALAALIQVTKEGDLWSKLSAASSLEEMIIRGGEFSKKPLTALIQVLKEGNRDTKDCAARALRTRIKLGDGLPKEVLAILIQALKEADRKTKGYIARVLGAIIEEGGELPEEALVTLIQAFKEGGSMTKLYTTPALGAMAIQRDRLPEEALATLIQAFKEGDTRTKSYVASALEKITKKRKGLPEEVLAILIQALKEADRETKGCAANALGVIIEQGYEPSKEALAILIQAFKEGDSMTKLCAASALGAIAIQRDGFPEEALATLIQAFKEGDTETKSYVASALEKITKKRKGLPGEVLAALIQAFKEGDTGTKGCIASTLREIVEKGGGVPKEALAALIQALREGDRETKHWAAITLREIVEQGGELLEEALATLIQAFREGDSSTKYHVAGTLGAMAIQRDGLPEEALAALIQAIKEGDTWNKGSAAEALKKINKNALLKMSSKAFALTAEVCFFTENAFSVKGQKVQISDKRTTYISNNQIELSYEQATENLPLELAEWRKQLDSLSSTKNFQRPTN
ncbi:HEAT repeat domain-containing protein [Parachlamydia sp. AcF125]|uniref:HEAT repeat domain-containing protein n=1 Tax=Parachlamydia sp. AcF125 TaxID=2795736 RepID=UPI001BC972D3|nr:HEAT repeat domain-containing protein [Parachlamydia sp. AcF125]MBS4168461.1 Phosphocholine transferase AnkX [Parachlamydia sp. AcF125]